MSSVKKLEKMLSDIKGSGRSSGGAMSKKWEEMQANPFFNPYYGQGYLNGGRYTGGGMMDKATGYDGILDYSARKSMYGGDAYQGGLSPAVYYPYYPNANVGLTTFGKGAACCKTGRCKKCKAAKAYDEQEGGFGPLAAMGIASVGIPLVKKLLGLGKGKKADAQAKAALAAMNGGALMGGRDLGDAQDFAGLGGSLMGGRDLGNVHGWDGGQLGHAPAVSVGQGRKSGGRSRGQVKDYAGMGRSSGGRTVGGNPWITHVNKVRKQHPNLSYKQALQEAKKSY
jgi:hypothetical protein